MVDFDLNTIAIATIFRWFFYLSNIDFRFVLTCSDTFLKFKVSLLSQMMVFPKVDIWLKRGFLVVKQFMIDFLIFYSWM